jgi:hypothetical protein
MNLNHARLPIPPVPLGGFICTTIHKFSARRPKSQEKSENFFQKDKKVNKSQLISAKSWTD